VTQQYPPIKRVDVRGAGASHEGPHRKHNEDAFAFVEDDLAALAVVADGTIRSGRNAADLVVETCVEMFRGRSTSVLDDLAEIWWVGEHGDGRSGSSRARPYTTLPIADRVGLRERVSAVLARRVPDSMGDVAVLEAETRSLLAIPARALERANASIYRRSEQNRAGWRGHAAAAICAVFAAGQVSIAHLGNCRAYLVRGSSIEPLTEEHTLRNEYAMTRPELTEAELDELPPNVIVRAVGMSDVAKLETRTLPLERKDTILLASDGLWKATSSAEILDAVRAHHAGAAAYLVRRGMNVRPDHPGDNLTVVVVEIR
jgi:serine/threonine protein phosphatase PrpC